MDPVFKIFKSITKSILSSLGRLTQARQDGSLIDFFPAVQGLWLAIDDITDSSPIPAYVTSTASVYMALNELVTAIGFPMHVGCGRKKCGREHNANCLLKIQMSFDGEKFWNPNLTDTWSSSQNQAPQVGTFFPRPLSSSSKIP